MESTEPTTYEELREQLEEAEDVQTVSMRTLRNIHGQTRLGPEIVKNIDSELRKRGIGHVPPGDLPVLRHEQVRLYRLGTPVAELIEAVVHLGDAPDEHLRGAAGGGAAERLKRIREIVCD